MAIHEEILSTKMIGMISKLVEMTSKIDIFGFHLIALKVYRSIEVS